MSTEQEILKDLTFEQFCIVASRDPAFFIEKMVIDKDGNPIILKPFHREWIKMFMENDRVIIIAPTGFGKTEVMGIGIPLWIAFFNKNKEILIISNTEEQAVGILDRIKMQINNNPFLKMLEPVQKDTWKQTEIMLNNNIRIFCKPYNNNLRSFHVNYIIADEVSQYKNPEIFFRYLITRGTSRDGKLVGITTVYSATDLSMQLMGNPAFSGKIYMAQKLDKILNDPDPDKTKFHSKVAYQGLNDGDSIFPEKYPVSKLMNIKEAMSSSLAYDREYLSIVSSHADSIFPEDSVIDTWDENIGFLSRPNGRNVYMGVDFAYGNSKDADYFVITIVETDGKYWYIRHIERYKGMPIPLQKQKIKELCQIWQPAFVRLDESNYGQDVIQELRLAQVPVINQKFDSQSRKLLIMNLVRIFQGNMTGGKREPILKTPRKIGGECIALTNELFYELTSFVIEKTPAGGESPQSTAAHDDMVMSLAMAMYGTNFFSGDTGKVFYF